MDYQKISVFTIQDPHSAMYAKLCDLGATLLSLNIPQKDHSFLDVVLGYENIEEYRINSPHFGSTIAPSANRIGGASFSINGQSYSLEKNDGKNNLHGGSALQYAFWKIADKSEDRVTFSCDSADGENGFPGNLHVEVTYTLQHQALIIDYRGLSDRDTIFNPTNHSYFNLKGHNGGDVSDHTITIFSDAITPGGAASVPDGTILNTAKTPFDFSTEKSIGQDIHANHQELLFAKGYDHNYILRKDSSLRAPQYDENHLAIYHAARVCPPDRQIQIDVFTDREGLQFYTANHLSEEGTGKNGASYTARSAFCLETQHFPNAINVPSFPSPIINAGQTVFSRTVYQF